MTLDPTPAAILTFAWDALARAPLSAGPPLSDAERCRLGAHAYREAPALIAAVCGALASDLFPDGEARAAALRAHTARGAALLQAEAVLADLLRRCRDERLASQAAATEGAMAVLRDHAAQREATGSSAALDLQALALAPAAAILKARSRRRGVRPAGRRPATTAAAIRADLVALKDARSSPSLDPPARAAAPLRQALRAVLTARGPLSPALARQIAAASDPDLLLLWIREAAGTAKRFPPGGVDACAGGPTYRSEPMLRSTTPRIPWRDPCEDQTPDSF